MKSSSRRPSRPPSASKVYSRRTPTITRSCSLLTPGARSRCRTSGNSSTSSPSSTTMSAVRSADWRPIGASSAAGGRRLLLPIGSYWSEPEPRLVGVWARYLRDLREPNVLEMHVQEWLSPFWLTTPRAAARKAFRAVLRDLSPEPDQTWGGKLRQTIRALTHPRSSTSEHYVRSGYRRSATGRWTRDR